MPNLWIDTMFDDDVASGSETLIAIDAPLSATERRMLRHTLTRLILRLTITPNVRDAGEGDAIISVGVGVASTEAFSAGTVANPSVGTDFPTRGWLYRARFRLFQVAADLPQVFPIEIDRDLRAQRKMENGRLFIVVENAPNLGVAVVANIVGVTRCLFLVP